MSDVNSLAGILDKNARVQQSFRRAFLQTKMYDISLVGRSVRWVHQRKLVSSIRQPCSLHEDLKAYMRYSYFENTKVEVSLTSGTRWRG